MASNCETAEFGTLDSETAEFGNLESDNDSNHSGSNDTSTYDRVDPKSILPNEHGPPRNPDAKKSKLTDKKGQGAKPKEIITRSKSSRSTRGSNSSSATPCSSNKQSNGREADQVTSKCQCGKCDHDIYLATDKWIQCDICSLQYHLNCGSVTDELYNILRTYGNAGSKDIPWHCHVCRRFAVSMLSEMTNMRRRQDQFELDLRHIKDEININKESLHEEISDGVREAIEQDKRKLNVVITNLPCTTELDPPTVDKVRKEVSTLTEKLSVKKSHIDCIEQIETDRGTLVKVKFKDMKSKKTLLANAKKLKNEEDYRDVYIRPDLTYDQRQKDNELRRTLRERRSNGEKNLRIVRRRIVTSSDPH